jgi:hypothetical protein
MRIFRVLFLFFVPLAAQAETDAELEAFLTAPPAPLDLAIMADDGAARTTVIGANGGSLELRNAAGDSFVLTFPEGALLTDTRITATPITESAGLPEGAGPITGLILEPDGLELARTATLEITPKTPIPPESRLHWGFYEDGKDAFLHIPLQDTDAIVIPIDHFSGAGIGFADRVSLQLDRWRQTAIQDRLSTRIAEELRLDRAGPPGRDSTATMRAIVEARAAVEAGQSALAFHPAATCDDAKRALQTILQLISRIQPLSFDGGASDDGSTDLIWKLFHRATSLCVEEALQICLNSGDLSPLTALAVEYRRILQNLSATGADTPEKDMNSIDPEVRAAMERCGRYKLTVQAKGHWVDGVGVYGDVNFKVEVPIRLKFTFSDSIWEYELVGEAPATDVNITFVDYACWELETYRQGAPMQVRLTDLVFDNEHTPKRVTLAMKGPQLFAVTSCTSKKRGKKTIESPVSESTWGIAHAANRSGPGYLLKTMKAGSHPKLFSYSWEGKGTASGVTSNDTTTLKLEHVGL